MPDCAVCCKNWDIDIDDETYQKLVDVKWEQFSDRFENRKIFIDRDGRKKFELIDSRCIFLDDDNYCLIHKKLGFDAKSTICKMYPFKFVKTPEGIIVRLSFVCPSVIKDTGVQLENQISEIEKLATLQPDWIRKIDETVVVDSDIKISYNDYKKIENVIFELLRARHDYETSLKAPAKFLRALSESLKKKESLNDILQKTDKEIFFRKKENVSKEKQKLYLALFVGYEFVGRAKENLLKKYANLLKLVFRTGSLKLNNEKFKLSEIAETYFDIDNENIQNTIKRFIEHLLFSKWHLLSSAVSTPNLVSGYSLLLVVYALVKWWSRAFALIRKSAVVELCDVEKAITFVELNYTGHITKETLFLNSRTFATICNLLISQPNFEEIII
ncbi:MAG: flagellin lysine-N-methylase [Elusimicrobiota bacterium]